MSLTIHLLLASLALAGKPTAAELDAEATSLAQNGRALYALAERTAAHEAACQPEVEEGASLFRGYLDTYIASAWRQKKPEQTLTCQEAVSRYFTCKAEAVCDALAAYARDPDAAPDPCAGPAAAISAACPE
jgi:hypothetical protein